MQGQVSTRRALSLVTISTALTLVGCAANMAKDSSVTAEPANHLTDGLSATITDYLSTHSLNLSESKTYDNWANVNIVLTRGNIQVARIDQIKYTLVRASEPATGVLRCQKWFEARVHMYDWSGERSANHRGVPWHIRSLNSKQAVIDDWDLGLVPMDCNDQPFTYHFGPVDFSPDIYGIVAGAQFAVDGSPYWPCH